MTKCKVSVYVKSFNYIFPLLHLSFSLFYAQVTSTVASSDTKAINHLLFPSWLSLLNSSHACAVHCGRLMRMSNDGKKEDFVPSISEWMQCILLYSQVFLVFQSQI